MGNNLKEIMDNGMDLVTSNWEVAQAVCCAAHAEDLDRNLKVAMCRCDEHCQCQVAQKSFCQGVVVVEYAAVQLEGPQFHS